MQRLSSSNQYQCYFKAEEDDGSAFRGCSCGGLKTHGIPCVHLVAVVKSCCIEGLNPINAMPLWWMTAHWHKQYSQGADHICNFDNQMLKNASWETTWRYCPPHTAPNKAGCPEKGLKSAIELASKHLVRRRKRWLPIVTSLMDLSRPNISTGEINCF